MQNRAPNNKKLLKELSLGFYSWHFFVEFNILKLLDIAIFNLSHTAFIVDIVKYLICGEIYSKIISTFVNTKI